MVVEYTTLDHIILNGVPFLAVTLTVLYGPSMADYLVGDFFRKRSAIEKRNRLEKLALNRGESTLKYI